MGKITKAFQSAYQKKVERGWDRIYVLVDIHDTIFHSCYYEAEEYNYYAGAREALRLLSNRNDVILIVWSSTYPDKIYQYLDRLELDNIHFDYINENPEVTDNTLSYFGKKMYFNVGLDDKFGFDPETEWKDIYYFFAQLHNLEQRLVC